MQTIKITIPDGCEIQIVRKEEEKECKFKKGDIIVSSYGSIAIFEKNDKNPSTNDIVVFFSTLYKDNELKYINKVGCGIGYERDCRFATSEEISTLINALKEEVFKGNNEAKKILKEVFDIELFPVIRTYQDLINNNKVINKGYWIGTNSIINETISCYPIREGDQNIATSEKIAKSMLAMAQISQLMPYYGGEITDEEWANGNTKKYIIEAKKNSINKGINIVIREFLAFHTEEQREEFLKYNERLVKDYLMIV